MYLSTDQIDLLVKHLDDGVIRARKHPTDELYIYNYTQRAQYEGIWDEMTMMCRGLILDCAYKIVARPFEKFFNYEEHLLDPTLDLSRKFSCKVYTKMDGSLGITYINEDDEVCVATRGSFDSPQAQWATNWIRKQPNLCHLIQKYQDTTHLFEIIYSDNRIVVNYDGFEGLVFLDAICKRRGHSVSESIMEDVIDLGIRYVPVRETFTASFDCGKIKELKSRDIENEEGYVICSPDGPVTRFKVKFQNYVQKHKIVSNLSEKWIWENLRNGLTRDELLEIIPDEWHDWAIEIIDRICSEAYDIESKTYALFYNDRPEGDVNDTNYRKTFAQWATQQENPALLFMILDDRDIETKVWDYVELGEKR